MPPKWTALQMVTRASAFERKGRMDGLRGTIEDASIASRMPFISSGWFPSLDRILLPSPKIDTH